MRHLLNILRFGAPYLKRYWRRLAAGILLGILFGLSNAVFVWATRTLFERLAPESVTAVPITAATSLAEGWLADLVAAAKEWLAQFKQWVIEWTDRWLPLAGRPLDRRQIIGGLLLLPFPVLLRGVLGYLSSYCMGWVSERLINDLRVDVLRKLNTLSVDYFTRTSTGDMLTRINSDTAALHSCLTKGFAELVKEPMTVLSIFVALCLIDWQLTLVATSFLAVCLVPVRLLGKKARKASQGTVKATVSQSGLLVEAFTGIRVIKAYGLEPEQESRFSSLSRRLIHHGMKRIQAKEMSGPVVETVAMLGLGVLMVWIFYSSRNVPDMVGFLTGMFLFYQPIKKIAALNVMFYQTSVGVDRLAQIFAEQPSVKESPTPKPLPAFHSAVRFEQVGFSYDQREVVSDIELAVPRGSKLGIAGESGSGKSTLINLLFRFYDPTRGRITIDGLDLRDLAVADLRAQLALVSQEIVLFDQTVAENIACGRRDATREEIEHAARQANAHEFISRLPNGYDTGIGERGVTLSGGQRQRLSIARAFVRNAPILVLDEATAALDSAAEAEVQAAIDLLEQNRTVISIAHRLSTLRRCDRIIMLTAGRIVEQGTFEELLRADGAFARMAARQGIHPS